MKWILIVLGIFVCTSCTVTRYIDKPVVVETVKTEYINQLYRDSIFIQDSIDRYISGDTVYQYKYKYVYKYLSKVDTVITNDTIQIPVEIKTVEIKEVNKLKWYQKYLIYLGLVSLISIFVALFIKLRNIT